LKKNYSHIVFALKNSRYDYVKIQRKKEVGFISKTYPFIEGQQEEKLVEILCKIATDISLDIIAFNFSGDHLHAIIAGEKDELSNKIGLWKGKTSYIFNRLIDPLINDKLVIKSDGTKQVLWAKSFYQKLLLSPDQLSNTIVYIKNNREKHGINRLSDKSDFEIERMLITSFKTNN
jgi:REP element-mobilizing transposase RayT